MPVTERLDVVERRRHRPIAGYVPIFEMRQTATLASEKGNTWFAWYRAPNWRLGGVCFIEPRDPWQFYGGNHHAASAILSVSSAKIRVQYGLMNHGTPFSSQNIHSTANSSPFSMSGPIRSPSTLAVW